MSQRSLFRKSVHYWLTVSFKWTHDKASKVTHNKAGTLDKLRNQGTSPYKTAKHLVDEERNGSE